MVYIEPVDGQNGTFGCVPIDREARVYEDRGFGKTTGNHITLMDLNADVGVS